jgi:HPt (histidine-containing phosphotransfer) domain-containing protein
MWTKFLPEMKQRVAILESAASAFAANALTIPQQEAASAAAHKLAGVLGTFGLSAGTDLARELEHMYSGESSPAPSLGARLTAISAELRSMVENH